MQIIKLNAIDSTNTYLRKKCLKEKLEDFTVVVADKQLQGRGQMGTSWEGQTGKNLTISVFKRISGMLAEDHFKLSMLISLAIVRTLEHFQIPRIRVKWPNDILSENKKVCGILIETIVKKNQLNAVIIGIGLNVNQLEFRNLPNATSMMQISGIFYDREEVLTYLLKSVAHYLQKVESLKFNKLKSDYESMLFRKDKPSTFKLRDGELLTGYIKGVRNTGELTVLLEDEVIRDFDLKEIQLLY